MENTRLLTLLRTIDRKERRDLRKFIATPFFNQRQDVIDLFQFLEPVLEEGAPAPEKKMAFACLYGEEEIYDDHKVRMAMSFLLKLTERYLVYQYFFDQKINVKATLAEIYRLRNLPKHFERAMREAITAQQNSTLRNAHFFTQEHQLLLEQYRFYSSQRRTSDLNLQSVADNLDWAYYSEKIRQACVMISHQAVYRVDYDFGLLEEILTEVEKKGLLEVPAISAYYYCYRSLTQPKESLHFQRLKEVLVNEAGKFPADEVADLYLTAINFCIKQYNEGRREYLGDQFELYKSGLERGIFLNTGWLSRFTYRNVVAVALVLDEYEWVERFLHDYKAYLEPKHRESMFSFNLARLEHQRKNYGAALHLLQQSEYRDLLLNLAAKALMLKVYFETEEYDALDSHLDAMKRFIRRKKLIGYHREGYLSLIHFTRKLMEANHKTERNALYSEIESAKGLAEQEWLLEVV